MEETLEVRRSRQVGARQVGSMAGRVDGAGRGYARTYLGSLLGAFTGGLLGWVIVIAAFSMFVREEGCSLDIFGQNAPEDGVCLSSFVFLLAPLALAIGAGLGSWSTLDARDHAGARGTAVAVSILTLAAIPGVFVMANWLSEFFFASELQGQFLLFSMALVALAIPAIARSLALIWVRRTRPSSSQVSGRR